MIKQIEKIQRNIDFSGTVLIKNEKGILADVSYGYANRSEQLKNNTNTRYGIASGCKLFTAIAVCQLVEKKKLSFDMKVKDYLEVEFPQFHDEITIHHLLTHTSGIPDYFDEEVMEDYEELWISNPMYNIRSLKDFLPLFQDKPMKLKAGERFHYNNAGYILLGLIVEKASQRKFDEYIQENIFQKAGMEQSGYFEFDALPPNVAQGYIDFDDGTWKTNIYSLPAKGGADGGAFVTAADMMKLWEALMNNDLLSDEYTQLLLKSHVQAEDGDIYYGYGVWIEQAGSEIIKYHLMGYDPGVNFYSAFYPKTLTKAVVCSNESAGAYDIMLGIEKKLDVFSG
ncbi:serine hydrolase domain-containing protein [Virgibacillus oceani]